MPASSVVTRRQGTRRGADDQLPAGGTRRRPAGLLLVAVVAGLALGRFLLFAPEQAGGAAAPDLDASLSAALAAAEQATAANPSDLDAWQELGVLATRRAAEAGDPSYYDLAADAFARAEALTPGHPVTLLGQGNLALSLHDFTGALELGRRALDIQPDSAVALGVVVDAEVELGDYDAAETHLQQMLDRAPDLPALSRTSYLRELHGDLEGAIAAMSQAEAAGSASVFDVATVAALLGDLQLAAGDLDGADEAYARAERLAGGIVPAVVGRARVLAARGDGGAAIALLEPMVERAPQPGAAVLLGELQALEGREADAAETFALVRAIAALQSSGGQVTDLEMARFEADHGDPGRAVELARRAHAARPDNVFAADALAWALHRAGQGDEALALVGAATRLGTADGLLRYHAAEVLAVHGDGEAARAELTAALALGPLLSPTAQRDALSLAGRLGVPLPAGSAALAGGPAVALPKVAAP